MSLSAILAEGRAQGAFPMAAAAVVDGRGRRIVGFTGGATERTRWDLASLTKPRAVVTVCMRLVSERRLELDRPLGRLGFGPAARELRLPEHLTARTLLGHRAGLPAWKDLPKALPDGFRPGARTTREAIEALLRLAAAESDPGRGVEYSDLGFMILGRHLERLTGLGLHALAPGYRRRRPRTPEDYASTGWCPWRQRVLQGEVHDPNAWALGGVAGHAGQFGTLGGVSRWAGGLLRLALATRRMPRAATLPPDLLGIDPAVVRAFWSLDERDPRGTWVLGWDTPTPGASSAGTCASPDAVGHLGFTGTSVWIDVAAERAFVLLTNRVAAGADAQPRLKIFRPQFHDLARDLAVNPSVACE